MGLFDFFKRRSKEDQPSEQNPVTSEPDSLTSEQTSGSSEKNSSASKQPSASFETTSSTSEQTATSSEPASLISEQPSNSSEVTSLNSEITSSESNPDSLSAIVTSYPSNTSLSDQSAQTNSSVSEQATTESQLTSETQDTSTSLDSAHSDSALQTSSEKSDNDADRYDKGLQKSRQTFGERLNHLLANFRSVDESFFDDLEETLIGADVGYEMAMQISDQLREEVKLQNAKKPKDVQNVVVEKLIEFYDQAGTEEHNDLTFAKKGPTVILFVGVNGVGKTTTIGKMAHLYKQQGKKVLLAAADTFRAGAIQQLNVWAQRDGVDIVMKPEQSDPSSVVFDAVQKAKQEDYDILFVDTAGRLQNKSNLMNELAKMKRVISREISEAPHEVLLVLDATTGQNALNQAKLFKDTTDVTGIVLTKLDGTARGGIVLAIRSELHLPVKYVGLGEQVNDLRPFNPNEFIYGLFKGLIDVN